MISNVSHSVHLYLVIFKQWFCDIVFVIINCNCLSSFLFDSVLVVNQAICFQVVDYSIHLCVCALEKTVFHEPFEEFQQIYNLDAVADKDEWIRF